MSTIKIIQNTLKKTKLNLKGDAIIVDRFSPLYFTCKMTKDCRPLML